MNAGPGRGGETLLTRHLEHSGGVAKSDHQRSNEAREYHLQRAVLGNLLITALSMVAKRSIFPFDAGAHKGLYTLPYASNQLSHSRRSSAAGCAMPSTSCPPLAPNLQVPPGMGPASWIRVRTRD